MISDITDIESNNNMDINLHIYFFVMMRGGFAGMSMVGDSGYVCVGL